MTTVKENVEKWAKERGITATADQRIEELEQKILGLADGGFLRHKCDCFTGEYNSILTGEGCDCGLSELLKGE